MRSSALPLVPLLAAIAACTARPATPILTWHEIGPDAAASAGVDPFTVPQARFIAQLDALAAGGFHGVTLGSVLDAADAPTSSARLPALAVALTFDDGTQDHAERVLPALLAHRMRATFFLVAGRIGADAAHRQFEQRGGRAVPYLIAPEVRDLARAGMELGAHGLTHARIPELDDGDARRELEGARAALAPLLGAPPELLAWPYNALRSRHREMARAAGYRAAVAGVVHGNDDRYSLYRIPVGPGTDPVHLVEQLRSDRR